jgi:hypothetical protein
MNFEKLRNRPVEEDTHVIKIQEEVFDEIPCILEFWGWNTITACSAIYLKEDIKGMSEDEITQFTLKHVNQGLEQRTTYKEVDGYVFVNYGFREIEL